MREGFHSHLHLDSTERSKLLSRLDEADARQPGHDKRRWKRWEYRMSDIAVIVQHPGGGSGRFLVCARNISAGGIAFIHGGYVHPGSECRILLPRRDGTPLLVAGVVVHCRHVESNHHEIGIRFLQEIDPAAILPSASADEAAADQTLELPTVEGQVVVVDQSDTDRRLMMHHLGATGLTLQMVESTGAALDVLRQRAVDLVLCDLNLEDDAVRMIEQMRAIEYRGPIIVVTAENDPARLAKAREAGANEIIGRPYNPLYLASAPGLGKTHLARAITAARMRNNARVIYTSSEAFTNQFTSAIRNKSKRSTQKATSATPFHKWRNSAWKTSGKRRIPCLRRLKRFVQRKVSTWPHCW